ncbi:MAG: porin family protein [Paludibacteraceae bacterium]
MKIYKLILVIVVAVLSVLPVNAQDKKVEFGLTGGYGYTMPKLKDSRTTKVPAIDDNSLNGFHFGPMVKFNLDEKISLQTGLLFNHFSGISINSSQLALKKLGTWYQQKTSLTAFDLPLRIMYSMPLADEFNFFLFAGPNLNYGLNKVTVTEQYVDKKLDSSSDGTNIYESPGNYNRLDVQMGAGLGVQYMGVSIRGSYDWGILNRTTLEKATLRSNDIKVSVGYTF